MAEQTQMWTEACQGDTKHELCFGSDCIKASVKETFMLAEGDNTIRYSKQEASMAEREMSRLRFYCVICGTAIEHPRVERRLCGDKRCKKIYASAYHRILRQKPEEKIRELERNRAWRKKPDVIIKQKAYKKNYYKKNRKRMLAYQRKWADKNRNKLNAYARNRYQRMKEQTNAAKD